MSNPRQNGKRGDSGRDAGGFIALPWSVLDCPAYIELSHPARSLLAEFARQFVKDNNGRLLASAAYLAKRGWKSNDVINRAKRELLDAGFIFQTVQGQRPNRASWYAVTWRTLDRHPDYDVGVTAAFRRGAYQTAPPVPAPKPSRDQLYRKWDEPKNAGLTPSGGVEAQRIAPSHGVEAKTAAPSHGAIRPVLAPLSTPSHGDHLDMPSVRAQQA